MKLDLFRLAGVQLLLRSPFLQRSLQLLLLAGYVGLVLLGIGRDSIPGVGALHPLMYTHATTLLFWVIWLMGLVLLVPFAGRLWCAVCPFGYLSEVVGRWGLGLRWPGWIRAGWGALVLFALGVYAVVEGEAHRSPHRTALLIGAAGAVLLLSALLWRRSAFCRGLCPVGAVLHLYSRYALLRILPVVEDGCADCSGSPCASRQVEWRRWDLGRWVLHRRVARGGCPVALYPPAMDTGACLLCLRCLRQCPRGNLGLFLGGEAEQRPLDPARLLLLVVLLGLVGYALLRTWPLLLGWLTPGLEPSSVTATSWLVLGLPLLILGVPRFVGATLHGTAGSTVVTGPGSAQRPGPKPPPAAAGLRYGAAVVPLIGPLLGAHAAIALIKLNAKGGYLPYLFLDPEGVSTYLAIHASGQLPLPDLIVPLFVLRWLVLGVFGVGVLAGVVRARALWVAGSPGSSLPGGERALWWLVFLLLSGGLGATLVHWLF